MEDVAQSASRPDFVGEPTPGKAASYRKRNRKEHDELRTPFAVDFGKAGSNGNIDGVEDHDVDDGIDGVSVKHAADEEPKQPGEFLAVAERLAGAAQRIKHCGQIDRARIGIAAFLNEEQTGDREEQKRNGVECKEKRLAVGLDEDA